MIILNERKIGKWSNIAIMDFFKGITDPPTMYTTPRPRPPRSASWPQPPAQYPEHSPVHPPPLPQRYPPPRPTRQTTSPNPPPYERNQERDAISQRFDDVMSLADEPIDDESIYSFSTHHTSSRERSGGFTSALKGNYFAKVNLYSNSRVQSSLLPCFLPSSAWNTVALAAKYSYDAYSSSSSRHSLIASDWRSNSKAMLIKAVSNSSSTTIILAIRGTSSFKDWTTNIDSKPVVPESFLPDQGNAIHGGFLEVARSMMPSIASHLQDLLHKQSISDSPPQSYNLLVTGHSAGGAVAILLYTHLLSNISSPLSSLSGLFNRIHCITFGAPPISFLPLTSHAHKSLFLSFVNEGDPVSRAEVPYMRSLLDLLSSPAPKSSRAQWELPEGVLCNAGKIIVLRQVQDRHRDKMELVEGTEAVLCHEDDLRGIVWGDPLCHLMMVYLDRINLLAGRE